ncbi:MAG TPA: C40 family peptidase [Bacteroidia bacterium]|nr:C40 family peptidase [Bacteroidia bacterium]
MFAYCPLSVVPVRKDTNDRSEMVTQLLFGDRVEVLDKYESWRKIRMTYDSYTGWVDKKQIAMLEPSEFARLETLPPAVSLDIVQLVVLDSNHVVPVVLGSSLTGFHQKKFSFGNVEFQYEGNVAVFAKPDPSLLLENAYMYLNAPYLWGGRSPFGIDCSGFTQMAFKLCGIPIERDAAMQAEQGMLINLLDEAVPGDLLFFDNKDGKIIHVGFLLPNNQILHASGRVRIDKVDHQGIYNVDMNTYTHNLRLIRRMI